MLTAKFTAPRPQTTDVRREHLLAAVRTARTPVVLISAPAGWGKTRLAGQLADEVAAGGRDVIWLTADAFDDDAELWADLFAAARHAGPALADAFVQAPTPPAVGGHGSVDRWLAAAADLGRPVTLVIDDLHQITDRGALSGLARLVALAPQTLRVVFAARHDPALPVARWRMQGLVTELRAADLAADDKEAGRLLDALGVPLAADDLALLVRRTEGWIGGIRLAGQLLASAPDRSSAIRSLTGGSGGGSLARYLIEQVVDELDPGDRSFLRDISSLTTVSVDLAVALTGRRDALATLRRLVTRTGFVSPVDAGEGSFRCHQLLAAALRYDLESTDIDRMNRLLRTAARWYADRDRAVEAVRCALRATDWPMARDQLVAASARLTVQGRSAMVRHLLAAFPRSFVVADPELAGVDLAARMWTGDRTDFELLHESVDRGLPGLRARDPVRADVLAYKLAMADAALARIDGAFERLRAETAAAARILDRRPDSPELAARRQVLVSNAGTAALWLGDEQRASALLTEVIGHDDRPALPVLNCLSLIGWIDLMQGRLTAAATAADRAIATARRFGWSQTYQVAAAFVCHALIAIERLDLAGADQNLNRAEQAWRPMRELATGLTMATARARLLTARGRAGDAVAQLDGLRADHRIRPTTAFLEAWVGRARVEAAAAGGDWSAVARSTGTDPVVATLFAGRRAVEHADPKTALLALTEPAHQPALGRGLDLQIRRQLWLGRACQLTGRRPQAVAAAREALTIARHEGYRLPFLELGGHARPLLRMLQTGEHGPGIELAAEILAALPEDAASEVPRQIPAFTPREQDLLTVLPTRMSNDAIARLLNVSPNTVKTHLRSVYRKLGVEDRDSAVERAGRLGLL